jgi:hypothetical protein
MTIRQDFYELRGAVTGLPGKNDRWGNTSDQESTLYASKHKKYD